jgi:hypothetical protein
MILDPPLLIGSPPEAASSIDERKTVSNRFGTVTNLAVYYNVRKNLLPTQGGKT